MIDKETIFDNIGRYSAEQIVELIKQGIVTELELEDSDNTCGNYSADLRAKVKALLTDQEPADWEQARTTDTIEAYQKYLDTYPDGHYREEARTRKRELQEHPPVPPVPSPSPVDTPISDPVEEEWQAVDKDSMDALQRFVESHPGHPLTWTAQARINALVSVIPGGVGTEIGIKALVKRIKNIEADKRILNQQDAIFQLVEKNLMDNFADTNRGVSKNDLVGALAQDKNLLNAAVVHQMYDRGFLSYQDFYNIGIDGEFVQYMLEDIPVQRFSQPYPLTQISRRSTEVYFWGIPSSGKSCALGGILSVANNGKVVSHMDKDPQCQGYGYMSRLMLHFKNDGSVCALPEGTATTSTYEMGFDLTDHKGVIHPITCVDLAGELIRCMFKSDSGEDMSDDELNTLDTLTNILVDNRTGNQKMHFFVVEYGADDRLYEGLPQRTYLEAAVQYINNYNIFRKDTDAIFILVSKVDKAPGGMSRSEAAVQYLNDNYLGFINGLKALCRRYEINGGDLEVLPFSLGEVCFQNYCRFHEAAAEQVVRKIVERSKGFKEDKFSKFKDRFKG